MSTVKIADNADALKSDAEQAARLHSATGWELAAYVFAWTYEGGNQHDVPDEKSSGKMTLKEFASLDIRGLKSRDAVRKYRRAWQAAIDKGFASAVEPGDEIELPDIDFNEIRDVTQPKQKNQSREERQEERKQEEPDETELPRVEDIPDDDLGETSPSVEVTKTVDQFVARVEYITHEVENHIPGMVGTSLSRLADSITDVAFDEDPRRSYLHSLDALAELVSAIKTETDLWK